MTTQNTTLIRDDYGALHALSSTIAEERAAFLGARALISLAAQRGKIPAEYDDMRWERINSRLGNKKIGHALHHEIYDLTDRAVLVCCRSVEGTRYGQKTTGKRYFLVARHGRGVRVTEASKALAAKAAKAAGPVLGAAIDVIIGKAAYTAPANRVRTGFKLVARADDGGLVSAWDGSPWTMGKTRTEAATEDHRGGYYYYASADEAIEAAAANDVFGDLRDHRRLVLVEVEASGRHYEHAARHGTKLCASRIRPVREVAVVI